MRLLVVAHTTSPALHAMHTKVLEGARDPQIQGVEVVTRPALTASAVDVLEADGYILGTPVNLGYMSGALKHFFDQIYYPCLEACRGRPIGLYVHGNNDTGGAVTGIEKIITGLGWRWVAATVSAVGQPGQADLDACWELGATVAAVLTLG